MSQQHSGAGPRPWAELTLGERIVTAAWRAVAAHLAASAEYPTDAPTPAEQVATGGAGALDGVTGDALLPPALRRRLREPRHEPS